MQLIENDPGDWQENDMKMAQEKRSFVRGSPTHLLLPTLIVAALDGGWAKDLTSCSATQKSHRGPRGPLDHMAFFRHWVILGENRMHVWLQQGWNSLEDGIPLDKTLQQRAEACNTILSWLRTPVVFHWVWLKEVYNSHFFLIPMD